MCIRDRGHTEDAAILRKRALNYKNVIDPVTGYARGRHADGRWSANFDPFASRASFITEGSPAQYTFFVPHDVAGLMKSMGGKEAFVNKLDTLFGQGHYWHGNEPNHQIAYLYAYAGQPWKTQKPVSYTHLDVYKRQSLFHLFPANRLPAGELSPVSLWDGDSFD